MEKSKREIVYNFIGIFVLIAAAVGITAVFFYKKWNPTGGDIWGHLYKTEYMFNSIKSGNYYPIFDENWYNGIQLYRYWPPLSYYVLAGLMFTVGGSLVKAYYLFAGFAMFVGGLPWVILGNIKKRRVLGTFMGVLWFFMPEIFHIYLNAGNLPQMTTAVFIPYVILFLWLFIRRDSKKSLIGLFAFMFLITLTHLMVAAIVGVASFVFLFIDQIKHKNFRQDMIALLCMFLGIMTAGVWLLPAVTSGMVTSESGGGGVMSVLIYPIEVSLNPLYRVTIEVTFYYGLAIILISIFGIIFARGNVKAGFIFNVVFIVLTTPEAYFVLSKLPFSRLFWMTRFSPVMYGFFFLSFMEWNRLKEKYAAIMVSLLLLDLVPEINMERYFNVATAESRYDTTAVAKATKQRATVIDLSTYGCYPSYGISGEYGKKYSFGWAWQGAATAENIMLINEALECGYFNYMFDRCIEMGDDTVLVQKYQVVLSDGTKEQLFEAASNTGYELIEETVSGYIFKKNTPECFGVVTKYEGIAIGKYANEMTLVYPNFCYGKSVNIDDYTFEDLKDYSAIFLSGFKYTERKTAEELLIKLADSGVRIVIDTTHLQAEGDSKQEIFLGVLNQTINFTNNYPALQVYGKQVNTGRFIKEDENFTTGYISYLDEPLGTFEFEDRTLTFFGRNKEYDNIYFLGLNMMYYTFSTGDAVSTHLLDSILEIPANSLPVRQLIPLSITREKNIVTIVSPADNVNTTIANQDIFSADLPIDSVNNFLVVGKGETTIYMKYPLFYQGMALTVIAAIGFALLYYYNKKYNLY